MNVYLDHAASCPLSRPVIEYLIPLLGLYGNPSSLHSTGAEAGQLISSVRKQTALFIHADADCIYFTSGGAASNTLAVKGYRQKNNCRILYSPTLHPSILNYVHSQPDTGSFHPLKVDRQGLLDLDYLEKAVLEHPSLVVTDYANSELGTIQDVRAVLKLVHSHQGIVYLDCTGSIPSIPLDVKALDADMCGFSAHKLGGLKGCGVLYKKPEIKLEPLIYGSQEQGLLGGTENLLGIASLGRALENYDYSSVSPASRDYVYRFIIRTIPDSYLVGSLKNRLAHNLYICFKGIDAEALVLLLDLNGIQVSAGSACHSSTRTASAALSATGMNSEDMHSCIRMSFCGRETPEELDYVCAKLYECVNNLRTLHTQSL